MDGVTGIGIGEDDRGNEAIVISVDDPDITDQLPDQIEGFPVVVKFEGRPIPDTGKISASQVYTGRYRPIKPGVSFNDVGGACTSNFIYEDDSGTKYIASNNHCIADTNSNTPGTPVFQPSTADGGDTDSDKVGELTNYHTLADWVSIDFAWAEIDDGIGWTAHPHAIGDITGGSVEPEVGDSIELCGRTSGHQTGEIEEVGKSIEVEYSGSGSFILDDIIQSTATTAGGDSGAPVARTNGNEVRPVGIHFASGGHHCKVTNAEDITGLEVVTEDEDNGGGGDPPGDPIDNVEIPNCRMWFSDTIYPNETFDVRLTVQNDNPFATTVAVRVTAEGYPHTETYTIDAESTTYITHRHQNPPSETGVYDVTAEIIYAEEA